MFHQIPSVIFAHRHVSRNESQGDPAERLSIKGANVFKIDFFKLAFSLRKNLPSQNSPNPVLPFLMAWRSPLLRLEIVWRERDSSRFAMGQICGDVTTHYGDEGEGGKVARKEQLPQLTVAKDIPGLLSKSMSRNSRTLKILENLPLLHPAVVWERVLSALNFSGFSLSYDSLFQFSNMQCLKILKHLVKIKMQFSDFTLGGRKIAKM